MLKMEETRAFIYGANLGSASLLLSELVLTPQQIGTVLGMIYRDAHLAYDQGVEVSIIKGALNPAVTSKTRNTFSK